MLFMMLVNLVLFVFKIRINSYSSESYKELHIASTQCWTNVTEDRDDGEWEEEN